MKINDGLGRGTERLALTFHNHIRFYEMLTKCLTVALIPNLKCLNSRYLNFFDRAKYDASNEAEAETLDAALGVHL